MTRSGLRVAYAPYAKDMNSPGDRRRFGFYAKAKDLSLEQPDPRQDYDLVYLSTRADISAWAEYQGRAKIVFEIIDSYLALSEKLPKNRLRGLAKFASREMSKPTLSYRSALIAMARRADAVVCSTEEQREQLSEYCSNVHVILDVHEESGQVVKQSYAAGEPFNLVWEGLAYTLDAFETIAPSLRGIHRSRPLALHLITDLRSPRFLGRFVNTDTQARVRAMFPHSYMYQWNPYMLATIATRCDLGLIPLDLQDPFSRGKPENKLLLLWRMGIPTITSASPAYRRAMASCGLDMVCETPAQWEEKLTLFIGDEALRREAGTRGRQFVDDTHSKEAILAKWDGMMESVLPE